MGVFFNHSRVPEAMAVTARDLAAATLPKTNLTVPTPGPGPTRELIFRAHCFRCLKLRTENNVSLINMKLCKGVILFIHRGVKFPLRKRVGNEFKAF